MKIKFIDLCNINLNIRRKYTLIVIRENNIIAPSLGYTFFKLTLNK